MRHNIVIVISLVLGSLVQGCGSSSSEPTGLSPAILPADAYPPHDFAEGRIESTERALDLAIRGDGFFVVRYPDGETLYTRSGSLIRDPLGSGRLTTRDGFFVQGYTIDSRGRLNNHVSDIQVTRLGLSLKPKATRELEIILNLDARSQIVSQPMDLSTIHDLQSVTDASLSIGLYDAVGSLHQAKIYFVRISELTWQFYLLANQTEFADEQDGSASVAVLREGTLSFDQHGQLVHYASRPFERGDLVWNSGAVVESIEVGFGPIAKDLTAERSSQFASALSVHRVDRSGHAHGELQSIVINKAGLVSAIYTNGVTEHISRLALVAFKNPSALRRGPGTQANYVATIESGASWEIDVGIHHKTWLEPFALDSRQFMAGGAQTISVSQRSFVNSSRATDFGIEGAGYFVVRDPSSNDLLYTRHGRFGLDAGGIFSLPQGLRLLGYRIDGDGKFSQALEDIALPLGISPKATTQIEYRLSLKADETVRGTRFDGSTFGTAAATANHSSSTIVYDALGVARSVTTYFRKVGTNRWSYHVLVSGSELANYRGVSGGAIVIAEGLMDFDLQGRLQKVTKGPIDSPINTTGYLLQGQIISASLTGPRGEIQWTGGGQPTHEMAIILKRESDAVTQIAQDKTVIHKILRNGHAPGNLESLTMAPGGILYGVFNNGVPRPLWMIPLASFANAEGLQAVNGLTGTYQENLASGSPSIGRERDYDRGQIRTHVFESIE